MLREQINEALDVLDSYAIPERLQQNIIMSGVNFDFTHGNPDPWGRNYYMDLFTFASFLKRCQELNIKIDAIKLLNHPNELVYEKIINLIERTPASMETKNMRK